MIIDAHHHFWQYTLVDYGWIDESMGVLRRDFLPADLEQVIRAAGVDGVIAVQARQSLEETRWLLDFAATFHFVRGVVGWVPLASDDVDRHLDAFSGADALKAVRHVVQDEPDDDFILGDAFNQGVRRLHERGLVYDILIYERHLSQTIQFVDRHPKQVFVLDHLAKPRIKDRALNPWNRFVRELAERENVYCKISGLATEADWSCWTVDDLTPYLNTVLECFGPQRLMFGSDWPVCLCATQYGDWLETVQRWSASLAAAEQQRIFAGTAVEAYHL